MRNDFEHLNRRSFLRLTSASTAGVAASSLFPHPLFAKQDDTPLTTRPPRNRSPLKSVAIDGE